MPNSHTRSKYEAKLASAHRMLYWASVAASEMGDEGAEEDILALMRELSRLTEDSLRGKRQTARRQLALDS